MLRKVGTEDPERARLLFHRKLFLWTHGILGFLSMCIYLNQILLGPFAFLPGAGSALILISMPALWPYLVSALISWQFVSEQQVGLYLFLAGLLISGLLSMALALGAFGVVTDTSSLLKLYYYQTVVHFFISWLLDVDIGSPSNNRWRGP